MAQNERAQDLAADPPPFWRSAERKSGEGHGNTMALAAGEVETLVIPGCGHGVAEEAPEELLAALTACRARTVTDR
ncbi:MAG TPA: hypothetical protein VG869_13535 [Acidimicrobiia bacterium]|jgi:pimeloyl-ACP methyl ester carboxylesterase|nr:hypothetical protein [Acidimicrobiia bacterium]